LLPPRPEEIAHLFPQLEILESLGRGGMGVVYKARQRSLDRFVALKLLAPERARDPEFAARFQREAQALARLSHPNIVTIHDFGQAGDFYFLLMEYVDGINLRQLLRAKKLLPEEALAIVPSLCDALQYAHERGIVHRDIKPENLLLDRDGRVKIADFGIAKLVAGGAPGSTVPVAGEESASTSQISAGSSPGLQSQSAAGTPGYMAPEQRAAPHQVDSRADIYSLGVVFYEMLTGERPTGPIQPPSSRMRGMQIDVRLDEVVLRALEQEPNLRWQSAADLRTQLQLLTDSAAVPTRAAEVSPARHLWRGLLVGLLVLVTGAALAFAAAFVRPEPHARVMLLGTFAALLAAAMSCWSYVARAKRSSAGHGANPPRFLTTAPNLGLALVIASLVVPLGFVSTLSMASRMRLVTEHRHQADRVAAAERALAVAQRQVKDLEAQSQDAQRTLKQLRESPVAEANSVAAADERVKQLERMSAAAEADRQAALRQAQQAKVTFHSEVSPGIVVYMLPAFLLALPGTVLGWRHLLAIRGLPHPRPHQLSGMIAALTWPLLLGGSMVGAIVLLPFNHGVWVTLGLVLAMLAVLVSFGLTIARVRRWLQGLAFFPPASGGVSAMPDWTRRSLAVLFLSLAVLVPFVWIVAVRSDNSRELQRWHLQMTHLQRDWTQATTDRFTAQTALDRHAIAAAGLTSPQEKTQAEAERRKLTRALGQAEAMVATLDTKMRALNETGVNRNNRVFEQQIAPILIGVILSVCGLLLIRRPMKGLAASAPRMTRTAIGGVALGAILSVGIAVLFLSAHRETTRGAAEATTNAQLQVQADPSGTLATVTIVTTEDDLVEQTELRVLKAQYEKVLNEAMNAQRERDLLTTRTGLSREELEREAAALEQKIRVLSDHSDVLRRKIETLKH
jgi:predicted Ser/Thr protein kinase